jgi:sugar phosphate isomerase/epimerase
MNIAAMTASASTAAPRKAGKPFFEKIGKPIGIQVYTLGEDAAKDPAATFARLAEIGYKDLELPNLLGKSAAELRAAGDAAGVKFSSLHLAGAPLAPPGALGFGSSNQAIVDALGTLGITDMVLPIALVPEGFKFDPTNFKDSISRAYREGGIDGWKRTAQAVNAKAQALSAHGITVGYHNHNNEFAPLGKTTGWQVLLKEFDRNLVQLELDLGWVAAAGLDPAAELTRLKGRVRWVHVKDVKAGTKPNFSLDMNPTQIGDGKLNWPKILRAAEAAGVRHYYVEQEPPFAMARINAAARSFKYLAGVR